MDDRHLKTNLGKSSCQATEFARQFVYDELQKNFLYDVKLNQSYDRDVSNADYRLYPNEYPLTYDGLSADDVVSLLCRDGYVPVWIDIYVKTIRRGKTVLELLCAGRYSNRQEFYYYQERGTAPFGVKSPVFPPGWNCSYGRFRLCPTVLTCLLDMILFRWRVCQYSVDRNSIRAQMSLNEDWKLGAGYSVDSEQECGDERVLR